MVDVEYMYVYNKNGRNHVKTRLEIFVCMSHLSTILLLANKKKRNVIVYKD